MADYTVNKSRFGTHQLVVRLLAPNDVVLDVGCNKGYLASLCAECEFHGIDYDAGAVQIASTRYRKAYQADLNSVESLRRLNLPRMYNKILLIDVLEHLLFPEQILKELANANLAERGSMIISLPNIAHLTTRLNLLLGRFNYTETGILDRTHLHLYTVYSARQMLASCGLRIRRMFGSSDRFGRLLSWFPVLIPLLGFNLIFECTANRLSEDT